MDFIARAGSMFDKSTRLAGLFFILLLAESVVLFNAIQTNKQLNLQYEQLRNQLQVYVVPGSVAGVYSPKQDEMLTEAFVTLVTQNLNTFTYENLSNQYAEVKKFFSPDMLVFSDKYFGRKINTANIDERSSLFVVDRSSLKDSPEIDRTGQPTGNKTVTVQGQLHNIIAGTTVEAVPLKITLGMKETLVTKTNPFGFVLTSYKEEELQPERPQ